MIEATLVAAGRPERFNDRFGTATTRTVMPERSSAMSIAAGTASLPDGSTFELVDGPCTASEFDVMFWANRPHQLRRDASPTSGNVSCEPVDETGVVGLLFIDVDDERTSAFVDIFVDPELDAFAEVPIVDGHVSAPLEYVEPRDR